MNNLTECKVNEQNNILKSIKKLAMPAYENALQNKKHLAEMEKRAASEANEWQVTISIDTVSYHFM